MEGFRGSGVRVRGEDVRTWISDGRVSGFGGQGSGRRCPHADFGASSRAKPSTQRACEKRRAAGGRTWLMMTHALAWPYLTHADAARPPLFGRAPNDAAARSGIPAKPLGAALPPSSDVAVCSGIPAQKPRPPKPDTRPPIPKTPSPDTRPPTPNPKKP
jgi:hypothetical protein